MGNLFSKNNRLLSDFLLVALILIFAFSAFGIFKLTQKEGRTVSISVDGKIIAEYSLDKDIKKTIKTDNGENVLVISGGKAYIDYADCPDKICKFHKPISKTGQSIVCLPHKLVICVQSKKESDKSLDAHT